MPRIVLSPETATALELLAGSIRAARLRRGWTIAELAERVGVSRPTIAKIERADPGVAIGTAFEAARLVGVPLFTESDRDRERYAAHKRVELELLPASARPRRAVDDDF